MRKSRRWSTLVVVPLALAALVSGCAGGGDEARTVDRDTLTRRQKDSIVSEMPLPGAGAVGRAMDAADAAKARAEAHDTIG
jgi:hypothetical protein